MICVHTKGRLKTSILNYCHGSKLVCTSPRNAEILPGNQAESTTPPTEETTKATLPKPPKPKSSVIQARPEGERIHPEKAEGCFAKLRIAATSATQFVLYVIPWFNWNGRQAVSFSIPNRHSFIFGLSLGMNDLVCLALLLTVCTFGLF